MTPSKTELFQAIDATWPAFAMRTKGIWTLREGKGAGQRVSAASTAKIARKEDVEQAASVMREMGQAPLFMVRGEQPELDGLLEDQGYQIVDPVDVLMMRCESLAEYDQSSLQVIFSKGPLAIMEEIWQDGGIDAPRLAVMDRAAEPNTCLMGRYKNRPVGVSFLGCYQDIAMVHAVEVLTSARKQGVAEAMMRGAAWWAAQQNTEWFTCLTTSENAPAQGLYRKMGMEVAAHYHYRKLVP
ncbi:MAG: GNAT family N-acetyltransferase [Rhodobacteraceae bacterium]|nr:GNAT family N-acetyltransferase [Paracoccaceae bacterium]